MREGYAVLLSMAVVGLMTVPGSVSADVYEMPISDAEDDLPVGWDVVTGEPTYEQLNSNWPMARVGYMDMVSYKLALDTDTGTFTFWMKVNGDLPSDESALPSGVKVVEWAMWIDPPETGSWNPVRNPVVSLYLIALQYDGESYSGWIMDYETKEIVLELDDMTVSGAEFQITFPAGSVGDIQSFWWSTSTRVWWGQPGTYGFRFADFTDWDAYPGDLGYTILWPPEA